jgi:hypothetical protein
VCIQETKIAALPRRVLLSALGSEFTGYVELPAGGASGGVLVAWRRHIGVTGAQRVDNNSISIQFSSDNPPPPLGGSHVFMALNEQKTKSSSYKRCVTSVQLVQGRGF